MATQIVSNELAADFGNSPQKTGEPVDRLSIYSGKALEFDGVSDYMTFPNVYHTINSDGDLTFAWWMNINNYAPGGTNSKIISSNPGLEITIYGGQYVRISVGNSNDYNFEALTNVWYRCVFTMEDTVGKFYVNGELQETFTHSSNFKNAKSTTGGFISKRHSTNMTHYVDGKLCDIQFWNATWDLADVQYDYLNPEKLITNNSSITSGITSDNIKVWYPMNDTGITNPQSVIFNAAPVFQEDVFNKGTSSNWDSSGWITTAGWSQDDVNYAIVASSVTNIHQIQNNAFESKFYVGDVAKVTYTLSEVTGGTVRIGVMGGNYGQFRGSNGTYTEFITITNNSLNRLYFDGGTAFTGKISNIIIGRIAQNHATSTFLGDNIIPTNKRDFTNSNGELRTTGNIINSGAAKHHSYYEILTQSDIDFTTYGAPDNYPGTVFCMNHEDGSTVPTFDANNTAYAIDLGIATDYSGGDASSKFGIAPNGDNKIYLRGPELVSNGGFETAGDGTDQTDIWANWTGVPGSGSLANETSIKYAGSDSAKLTYGSGSSYIYQDLTLTAGTVYRLNFYTYGSGSKGMWYRLYDLSNGAYITSETHTNLTAASWQHFGVYFTTPSGCTSVRLYLQSLNASGSVYVDSVSVKEADILSVEHVDQADGSTMYLDGSKSKLMSESLVSGRQYTLSANYKVNTGSTTLLHFDGSTNTSTTLNSTTYADASITFTTNSATTDFVRFGASANGSEITTFNSISIKEVGIATGWTDAEQQQIIPQTAFMDGCIKLIGPENNASNVSPHFTLDSTGTTTSGTAYSVSAWLIRTTTPGATDNYLIGHLATDRIYFASATQVFWKTDNAGTTIDLGVTIGTNIWEFWTFVSDGGTKRIYRNAQEIVSLPDTSPSNGFDYSRIGVGLGQESTTGFEGIIDELAIWDTVLSPTEVTELYNNGLPLNATKHSKYTTSASNLKAYWKNNHLNSDGKMKDQVGSNHATITETGDSFEKIFFQQGVTANLCTQGYSNNIVHPSKGSIHFLGQEYAAFPGERIINLDGDFTIEFWFKKTQLHVGSGLIDQMLFGSGNIQIRIPHGVSSGKMSVAYYRDAAAVGSYTLTIDSNNRKSIYEWSHVSFVRESGTVKLYIDAVTTDNTTISSTGQMQIKLIGAYSVLNGYMYKGFLDDLRIYDKALSAAEVTKNYNASKSQHKNN